MNITEAFATYLQSLGIGTLGQDLFIGGAPSSDIVGDNIWWVLDNGGAPLKKNSSGEVMKNYQVQVYARNRDYKAISDNMFSLEERLNGARCVELDGVTCVAVEASTFPIDNDLDSEDRKIGMLQATIRTYKEYQ